MSTPTILVVDDDHDSRVICEIILSRQGYRVLGSSNGEDALRLAIAELPDAVILDIALPDMDGWTVTERLAAQVATTRIPIILYSAQAFDEDFQRGKALGCAGYLVKPCAPQRILDAVREALDRTREVEVQLPEGA